MRVAIDCRRLDWPGIGRHIEALLDALSRHAPGDVRVTAVVLPGQEDRVPRPLEYLVGPKAVGGLADRRFWRTLARDRRLDLIHSPHFIAPFLAGTTVLASIHDAAPLLFRDPSVRGTLRWALMWIAHQGAVWLADGVVTVSQFSRNEIVRLLGARSENVHVVPNALPDALLTAVPEGPAATQPGTPEKYFLYVGTNKPWKNLRVAVEAFGRLAGETPDIQLVLAGKQARNQPDPRMLLRDPALRARVWMPGTLGDRELTALYRNALAVLCPSRYEGFGYTALEALQAGTPLIFSGMSAMNEVVGDAALTAAPDDVSAWTAAMRRLATDPSLRADLSARGKVQATRFSTAAMCATTIHAYRATLTRVARVPRRHE